MVLGIALGEGPFEKEDKIIEVCLQAWPRSRVHTVASAVSLCLHSALLSVGLFLRQVFPMWLLPPGGLGLKEDLLAILIPKFKSLWVHFPFLLQRGSWSTCPGHLVPGHRLTSLKEDNSCSLFGVQLPPPTLFLQGRDFLLTSVSFSHPQRHPICKVTTPPKVPVSQALLTPAFPSWTRIFALSVYDQKALWPLPDSPRD